MMDIFQVCQVDDMGEHCLDWNYEAKNMIDVISRISEDFMIHSVRRIVVKDSYTSIYGRGFTMDGEEGDVQFKIHETIGNSWNGGLNYD